MKKTLLIITGIFFTAMLVLTFAARSIHNASLPHVSVQRVVKSEFPFEYTDDSGNTCTGTAKKLAVTTEQFEQGVYVLYSAEKNGESRDFIRRADIVIGQVYGGYVEVVAGLSGKDRIVVSWERELSEGEVVVID